MKKQNISIAPGSFSLIASYITGVLGYHLNNNSILWGIIDGLFYPIAIIKWLVYGELTWSLIKESFPFILN